jgi:hypothetical protein
MQAKSKSVSSHAVAILVCATACLITAGTLLAFFRSDAPTSQRTLTFQERVAYQRAIEEVYWRHRIWPKERPDPKPPLDAVMSQAQLEKKVADYLRKSEALEDHWQRPITAGQLQAEMDRMAQHTRQPEVLHELFEALGNDPFVIAECLARPVLGQRLTGDSSAQHRTVRLESARVKELHSMSIVTILGNVPTRFQRSQLMTLHAPTIRGWLPPPQTPPMPEPTTRQCGPAAK